MLLWCPCCYGDKLTKQGKFLHTSSFPSPPHSVADLISSSVAKLEPLPPSRGQGGDGEGINGDTRDNAWVEETKERADRGCVSTILAFIF